MIGIDGAVRGATMTLKTQLPTAVADVNAEAGADVQLPVPPSSVITAYGDERGDSLAIHGVAVEVGGAVQRIDGITIDSAEGEARALIQVVVHVQEADPATLKRMLGRYARAVIQVMAQPDTVAPHSWVPAVETVAGQLDVDDQSSTDRQATEAVVSVILEVRYPEQLRPA